ncbi:hypothetical protein ANCCAN_14366 [Ancylostoma caninum]|uniref:Uncharacterized protein n=1 Tax=Ancylostoma caninum TaxID=29170 RepID=A0A368G5I7_ANCCA|nr:hypothetical protein ANCCAN_14366 [Ancylostoma caninum]
MFRTYEHGCKQYKPTLRLICSMLSLTISLCEFALAVYEYSYSRGGNIIAAIFTCVFSFHGCITLLYFIGIIRRNPCLLVPFLTLQVRLTKSYLLLFPTFTYLFIYKQDSTTTMSSMWVKELYNNISEKKNLDR